MDESQCQALLKLLCDAYAITEEGDLIMTGNRSMNDELLRLIESLDYRKARQLRPLVYLPEPIDRERAERYEA